jgi:hypothetical protein
MVNRYRIPSVPIPSEWIRIELALPDLDSIRKNGSGSGLHEIGNVKMTEKLAISFINHIKCLLLLFVSFLSDRRKEDDNTRKRLLSLRIP